MLVIVIISCNITQNLLYEIKELFAVNVVFKSKLSVIFHDFLENLIWSFLIYTFTVADKLDVFFCFFVKNDIRLILSCLSCHNNLNWFLNLTFIKQHIPRFSVSTTRTSPSSKIYTLSCRFVTKTLFLQIRKLIISYCGVVEFHPGIFISF